MNIGAIPKAAHVTNSTPQNNTMGLAKSLAVVYNDLQKRKEENLNHKDIEPTINEKVISVKDLVKAENQDKNRGIIENTNSRNNEDKEIGE